MIFKQSRKENKAYLSQTN